MGSHYGFKKGFGKYDGFGREPLLPKHLILNYVKQAVA